MSGYRKKCLRKKGSTCYICDEKDDIEVHHIDGNRTNNQLENLIPVCRYCHIGIHESRENYEHWHSKILPWYNNSHSQATSASLESEGNLSSHMMTDDLIFLNGLSSSAAKQIADIENGATSFQCPDCGTTQYLISAYSLRNWKTCPECSWTGPVHKGLARVSN